jgi:predicted  nucleic acid-binding Zn-ribbon protein
MSLHKCVGCGRVWGFSAENEAKVDDLCPSCSGKSFDELVEEIKTDIEQKKNKFLKEIETRTQEWNNKPTRKK